MKTFGPNTDAVNRVVERAKKITAEEAKKLADAWDALGFDRRRVTCYVASEYTWAAARSASRIDVLNDALDDVRRAVWDAAGATGCHALDVSWEITPVIASYAAQAAVLRDLISDEDYKTLAGPWELVMGPILT